MLNQLIICGRLTQDPIINELEEGKKESIITIAVPRSFKNEEGIYDTDFIDCKSWGGVAENSAEYLKKGDIVGVKGRLQTKITNDKKEIEIIAERVTFLSSNRKEEK